MGHKRALDCRENDTRRCPSDSMLGLGSDA